jgi:hypothetical protein
VVEAGKYSGVAIDTLVGIAKDGQTATSAHQNWTLEIEQRSRPALHYASRDRRHEHPAQHLQNFSGSAH